MGVEGSKVKPTPTPNQKDLEILSSSTRFSVNEVMFIWKRFDFLAKSQISDDMIDINEFRVALGLMSDGYTQRIFSAFNTSNSGEISFREFVFGLSSICPRASTKEKAKFVFSMFDIDKNGFIDKRELSEVLDFSLGANSAIRLPQSQLDKIVETTLRKMDKDNDGMISFEEFEAEANRDPSILSCVTLSIDGLFPSGV